MADYIYTMRGDRTGPVALGGLPQIAAQLDSEMVGWFTTVSPSGQPQSSAVWFLREADTLLMYSASNSTRLVNIESNPRVSFNLRSDEHGDSIVTVEGTALVDSAAEPAGNHAPYLDKYGSEIARLGWTPETFTRDFPTAIRVAVQRLRSWAPAPQQPASV